MRQFQSAKNDEEIQAILATLTLEQAEALTDYWGAMIESVAVVNKTIESCKSLVGDFMKKNKITSLIGDVFETGTGSSSSTTIKATVPEIIEILRKDKKLHLLDTVLSVSVGNARKALGDAFMDSISTTEVKAFATVKTPKRK